MKYFLPLGKKYFFTVPFIHIFCKTAYQDRLGHSTLEGKQAQLATKVSTAATLSSPCIWWPTARTFREMGPQKETFPCHFQGAPELVPHQWPSLISWDHNILMNNLTCQKWRDNIFPNFRAKVLQFVLKRFLTIRPFPLYIYMNVHN